MWQENHRKNRRRGKFYGCEDYPTCTFISNAMPTDTKCSQCGTIMSHRVLKTKEVGSV